MSTFTPTFFEEGRARFFSPLNGSRRELFAACIRSLYERLHGPNANHSTSLMKQEFRDMLVPVILDYESTTKTDVIDELTEERDPQILAMRVMKLLIQEGWIEQYADRQGLVTAFRLSRAGKIFAEAFWVMDRPSRSRHRNMRGCRNALRSVAFGNGDAHDLLDALEYSERVIQDLTDTIDGLQERVRLALTAGSLHDQWDTFIEFMERAQQDIVKQLTVDSAVMNQHDIRKSIEALRTAKGSERYQRLCSHLMDEAKWLAKEEVGGDPVDWLLDRVDELVHNAHEAKIPYMMRLLDSYFKRITGLLQQTMLIKTGVNRKVFTDTVEAVRACPGANQELLLSRIAESMALSGVRLLDPSSLRLKEATRREKASASAITPRPTREARLEATLRVARGEAFHLTNAHILETLKSQLESSSSGRIRLSELPAESAIDVLTLLRGVESVRGSVKSGLSVKRTGNRFSTRFHHAWDYEIRST